MPQDWKELFGCFGFEIAVNFFAKETEANPARIPPQTLPAGGKIRKGFAKSFSPENSFDKTESALKPHALPEYLEGSAWGFLRIICFGNRFELGTINTHRGLAQLVSAHGLGP